MPKIDKVAFEEFLLHEARLLDERRFREWMDLFTDDGTYWVPAVPNQSSPFNQASLFYDDLDLMKTRIDRLDHPLIHIQTPPSRTVHLVTNLSVSDDNTIKGEFIVSSVFMMAEYRDEQQRLFAGRQHHTLRRTSDSFKIAHKKVELINCDSAFEAMAVPI